MKTKADFHRHYWNVIGPMVENYNLAHPGAGVEMSQCVRWSPKQGLIKAWIKFDHEQYSQLGFTPDVHEYKFAVAILFDDITGAHRPVFPGDKIYDRALPLHELTVENANTLIYGSLKLQGLDWSKFSWYPPKSNHTFDLNGSSLPCPIRFNYLPGPGIITLSQLLIGDDVYTFETEEDRHNVLLAISSILKQAIEKTKSVKGEANG